MFKSLRFRLTLWFVCLASFAYALTTIATGVLYHHELTKAIDDELSELLAEGVENLRYENHQLLFVSKAPTLSIKPVKRLASFQLFDTKGQLLHKTGAPGVVIFFDRTCELPFHGHHLRSKSRRVFVGGNFVGCLQVQLPTYQREHAEIERLTMLLFTTPVLIILLAGSGYYFTTLTTKPIEEAVLILRTFMTNAGHELNTPLSSAQAVLDNLSRGDIDLEELPKKLAIISFSLTRMRNLVDDMILLAKLDSQRVMSTEFGKIALHELLSQVVESLQPLFDEKKISLSISSIADAWVSGNRGQLLQMITNLVENAVSYNKTDGAVSIALVSTASKAVLTVSDTGIGIPQEEIPRVFDRFFRVENSRSRETGGSGLGLSIVKAVVDSHNGEIEIDSQLGSGTSIKVTLPLAS